MAVYYPRYNPVEWRDYFERCISVSDQYPLCECDGVWINKNEVTTIKSLENKILERLAFTLLCLAKFRNYRNPDNNNWVNNTNGEIFSMACINIGSLEKDLRIHKLKELNLVEYAKKINNLSIKVLYVDEESEKGFFVSDFRKLGYEWKLYNGENYIRCADCGILIKKTSNAKRYCNECAKKNELLRFKKYYSERNFTTKPKHLSP
nr:MAG TPA: hypothetical protein [Caudoviricetes sp.]